MDILLVLGQSGVGKTTIIKKLSRENKEKYKMIHSYTDRPQRKKGEYGHNFLTVGAMDNLLKKDDVVAKTEINGKRYCTIKGQFDEDKINIYIVDKNGINDTIEAFPDANVKTMLIVRYESLEDIGSERVCREIAIPTLEEVDCSILNSGNIDTTVSSVDKIIDTIF